MRRALLVLALLAWPVALTGQQVAVCGTSPTGRTCP